MERREYRLSSATIHKLLDPLFLNELNNEFENIGEKDEDLEKLHHKICSIVIFDPACSTGEVLAEAYIGLRRLENRILKEEWSRFISKDKVTYLISNLASAERLREEKQFRRREDKKRDTLDGGYAALWYRKAGEYISKTKIRVGFIAVRSVAYGRTAAEIWNPLLKRMNGTLKPQIP